MNDDFAGFVFFIMIVLVIFVGGVFLGNKEAFDMKKEAIERGYALHCPEDGEWAWKGECDQK